MKYEFYLERVQQSNQDEFEDIGTILTRYNTLIDSNRTLEIKNKNLEDDAEKKKMEIDQYEKDMRQKIMQLTNGISNNKKNLEDIKMQQIDLNNESENVKSKKLKQMSELAQILMAIDNIEQKCYNRNYNQNYGKSSRQAILKHNIPDDGIKPKNYNDFDERHGYAKKQLAVIDNYAQDFKEIVSGLMADKGDKDKEGVYQMYQNHKNQGLII